MDFSNYVHLYYMKFLHIGQVAVFTIGMILFSILALFPFTLKSHQQTTLYYIMSQSKKCESASALAQQYFDKGTYVLVVFGLPDSNNLMEVMKTDYNVDLIYGGCGLATDETDCFNETMYRLLEGKFGEEFYERARGKARR
jgi:hypothetical protein